MKLYEYMISFFHSRGNGTACWQFNFKIKTADDVEKVRKLIEEKNGLKNVAIINFIKLKSK